MEDVHVADDLILFLDNASGHLPLIEALLALYTRKVNLISAQIGK